MRLPHTRTSRAAREVLWSLLDLVPIGWMLLVLLAYRELALAPLQPLRGELDGVRALEPAVLPMLAVLVATAILRYVRWSVSGRRAAGQVEHPTARGAQDTP